MSLLDKILEKDLFKARHGIYVNNAENRRLHRAGLEYGNPAGGSGEAVDTHFNFKDVSGSGTVRMNEFLSSEERHKIDRGHGLYEDISTDDLQIIHDSEVRTFNRMFNEMSDAAKAKKLYFIAKLKNELKRRKFPQEPPVVKISPFVYPKGLQLQDLPRIRAEHPDKEFPNVRTYAEFMAAAYDYNTKDIFTGSIPKKVLPEELKDDPKERALKVERMIARSRQTEEQKANFTENVLNVSRSFPVRVREYQNYLLYMKGFAPVADALTLDEVDGVGFKVFTPEDKEVEKIYQDYLKRCGFKKNGWQGFKPIEDYINSPTHIRAYLENGIITPGVENVVAGIDLYFRESKGCLDNISFERVLDFDNERPNRLKYLMEANVGDVFVDKSFASYSMGSDSVGRYPRFKITLLARKGQKVLPIYSDNKQGEREFIVQRGSKYRVLQKGFNSLVVELLNE